MKKIIKKLIKGDMFIILILAGIGFLFMTLFINNKIIDNLKYHCLGGDDIYCEKLNENYPKEWEKVNKMINCRSRKISCEGGCPLDLLPIACFELCQAITLECLGARL